MPTAQQRKSPAALFRRLSAKWPAAFNTNAPKPLKVGIHHEIRARDQELSDEEVKRALRAYTKMEKYLATMRAGAIRVDLDGNPSGEVSEGEAAGAQGILRARMAKEETRGVSNPDAEHRPSAGPAQNSTASPAKRVGVVVEVKRRRPLRRQGI